MRRRPKADSASRAKELNQHYWVHELGRWRCDLCGTWAVADDLTAKHEASSCPGHIADARAPVWMAMGHKIARVSGPVPFAFCSRCGAWGSRRTRNLAKQCAPPTPAGALALKGIARGKCPWRHRAAGGAEAPRANVTVTSVFNATSKKWQGIGASRSSDNVKRKVGRDSGPSTAVDAGAMDAREPAPQWDISDGAIFEHLDEDPFGHAGPSRREAPRRQSATTTLTWRPAQAPAPLTLPATTPLTTRPGKSPKAAPPPPLLQHAEVPSNVRRIQPLGWRLFENG